MIRYVISSRFIVTVVHVNMRMSIKRHIAIYVQSGCTPCAQGGGWEIRRRPDDVDGSSLRAGPCARLFPLVSLYARLIFCTTTSCASKFEEIF